MSAPLRLPNPSSQSSPLPDEHLHKGLPHTAGFADSIGVRQLVFDPAIGASVEVLRFKEEFGNSVEFEAALLARAEVLSHVQHPSLASIHTVGRHDKVGLVLVSRHTPGKRVSELLPKAQGPAFALELIRLVTPALAALHRLGDGVAHGALSADRIVVTRDGRLVVVEHALGSAIEALGLSKKRLNELGLAVPAGSDPVRLDPRTDMAQLGFIALSLLLGRRLDAADYPDQLPALLDEFAQTAGSPTLAAKLRSWLERAMQLSPKSFASAKEAQAAFQDLPDELEVQAASSALDAFHSETSSAPKGQPGRAREAAPKVAPRETLPLETTPARPYSRLAIWIAAGLVVIGVGGGIAYVALPALRRPAQTAAAQPQNTDVAAALPAPTVTPFPAATETVTPTPTPAANTTNSAPLTTPVPPATPPAAVAAAATAPAAAGLAPIPLGPRFGGVTVASPLDLQIFEDDKLLGSTAAPIAINEGTHNVELVNEPTGFRLRQTVNVRAGQMTTLKIAVPNGRVSVNAVPWAEVEVDGKSAGETPLANLSLPIGTHEFSFKHPQHGVRKQTVVVKVEGLTRVTQVFEPGK